MSQPAARIGDMTAHGGVIVMGTPTVLIGSMPAATVSNMHVCPLITVLVPHVGGPILPPGSPTVLIGNMPAARVGDMATCVGPPDSVVLGCFTVLIGASGSGSSGGGGGAAQTASYAAHAAIVGTPGPQVEGPHWAHYQFVDTSGRPVGGVDFDFTHVSGNIESGTLTRDGKLYRGMLPDAGQCNVKLYAIQNAKWEKESITKGEQVKLMADVIGFADGTTAELQIWRRDITGPDVLCETLESSVSGDKVEASWDYSFPTEEDSRWTEQENLDNYSSPQFYFIIRIGRKSARSHFLTVKDKVEIKLANHKGNPVANVNYTVVFANGERQEGQLDGSGTARLENVPPGKINVRFDRQTTYRALSKR